MPVLPGLDATCVARLVQEDLRPIWLPTASVKSSGVGFDLDSDASLSSVLSRRSVALEAFLREASSIIGLHIHGASMQPVQFESLAGDSHNGGRRPLLFHFPDRSAVLKFADPRPHLLLSRVLAELSGGIGVDLAPPQIIADKDNVWYMMPYIGHRPSALYDVDRFMFSMGALTAVSYFLRLADIHFENLIVDNGRPTIIDPECIFCDLESESPSRRLRSTGLVSSDALFSGMRGGDVPNVPMFNLELATHENGVLDYCKPISGFKNKVRTPASLDFADPAEHRDVVLSGYSVAYTWMIAHTDLICDIIDTVVDDDFQIRFLFRNTRRYATTIQILNLPCLYGREIWTAGVFDRFKRSASFMPRPGRKAIAAEWDDLQLRDVPYFWINAGEKCIRHKSGIVQRLDRPGTPKQRAINDVQSLTLGELDEQLATLNAFFDTDISRRGFENGRAA